MRTEKTAGRYVLKIDMPENLGGVFSNGITALRAADGRGYVKLIACDLEKKACLLERLGKPIGTLSYSVPEQLRIICSVLKKTWEVPAEKRDCPRARTALPGFGNL